MSYNPRTLVLAEHPMMGDNLRAAIEPEIMLMGMSTVSSPSEVINEFLAAPYDLCFVSNKFGSKALATLISDLATVENAQGTVFALLKESPDAPFPQEPLAGISCAVGGMATDPEIAGLKEALKEKLYLWEVRRRIEDVQKTMSLVLTEVDRVSRERKRGHHVPFNSLLADFLVKASAFHEDVKTKYFDDLVERTEHAKPETVTTISVPEQVLSKKLPKLSKNGYEGSSHRVWGVLLNKFGIKPGEALSEGSPSDPAPSTESETPLFEEKKASE